MTVALPWGVTKGIMTLNPISLAAGIVEIPGKGKPESAKLQILKFSGTSSQKNCRKLSDL